MILMKLYLTNEIVLNDLIFHVYVFPLPFLPFYKEFLQGSNENEIKDTEIAGEINVSTLN